MEPAVLLDRQAWIRDFLKILLRKDRRLQIQFSRVVLEQRWATASGRPADRCIWNGTYRARNPSDVWFGHRGGKSIVHALQVQSARPSAEFAVPGVRITG